MKRTMNEKNNNNDNDDDNNNNNSHNVNKEGSWQTLKNIRVIKDLNDALMNHSQIYKKEIL